MRPLRHGHHRSRCRGQPGRSTATGARRMATPVRCPGAVAPRRMRGNARWRGRPSARPARAARDGEEVGGEGDVAGAGVGRRRGIVAQPLDHQAHVDDVGQARRFQRHQGGQLRDRKRICQQRRVVEQVAGGLHGADAGCGAPADRLVRRLACAIGEIGVGEMDVMGLEDPQRGGQGVVDPGRVDRFEGLGKPRQLECIAGCPCPRGDKTQFHTTSLAAGCTAAWLCVEKTVPLDAMLEEYRSTGQDGAFNCASGYSERLSADADNTSMWWSLRLSLVDVCGAPRILSP
uniref:Uncharacterized protein n=1 Tax=Ralstonia solanacearum TaxID=305 RepID=A0A0S4TNB3_RALSL|nr:protein of unknown function [Ralstonia solanacearum]